MALDFTALTEAEIRAEETANRAGYPTVAYEMRHIFDTAPTNALPEVVMIAEYTAGQCLANRRPYPLTDSEPFSYDPGDLLRMSTTGGRWE